METTSKFENCKWCGAYHPDTKCPLVKEIEYNQDGTIKKIEFFKED